MIKKVVYPYFIWTPLADLQEKKVSTEKYFTTSAVVSIKINCFGKYSEKYAKSIDVFENLAKTCPKNVGLNLCYYVSVPGLSWDAMLKTAGVEPNISLMFIFMFVEKGMKEEICCT